MNADFHQSGRESISEWLDALPAVAYALTEAGTFEFVNRRSAEYTGLRPGSITLEQWRSAVHPADIDAMERARAEGLAAGHSFRHRYRLRSQSGEYRLFESVLSPVRDERGSIARWIGISTDIEDEALTTQILADSERRMRTLLDTIPQIVWTADASGWIDWYNPRWHEFTGQSLEEAAGWGWQAAHHPEDFREVMRRWPASIASGEPFEMEFRLRRHDGVFRWMLTRVVPLRDATGNVVRWYGSNTDIDDHKQEQLRSARITRLLQEAPLLRSLPSSDGFCFDAAYEQAARNEGIGGTWHTIVAIAGGRFLLSVGSVSEQGIDAETDALRLGQILSFAALEDACPSRILTRIHAYIRARSLGTATATVAVFDPASMQVTYALADSAPPIVAFEDRTVDLGTADGTALGTDGEFKCTDVAVTLRENAVFVLVADGMRDGRDASSNAQTPLVDAAKALAERPQTTSPANRLMRASLRGARTDRDRVLLVLQASQRASSEKPLPFDTSKSWKFHASHALSAHNARREIARYLQEHTADPSKLDEAELIVGELLANTVEHAPGIIDIEIDWSDIMPRLLVRDRGTGEFPPRARWPTDIYAEGGRGLALVHSFANDVRVQRFAQGGSLITCTLPVMRSSSASRE